MSSTIDLAAHRDAQRAAFARVCADHPQLTISGFKTIDMPPPFTDEDIDTHAALFGECVSWVRAFRAAAPGVNTESDLARDCLMSWRKLRGITDHVPHGVFIAACIRLGIAGPRRRGRPDVFIGLSLAAVLLALDAWEGPDGGSAHQTVDAIEEALTNIRVQS
jgi:hypothetical protein